MRRAGGIVVFDATFNVERGELALLAGDSGSGKSTLLAVLGGLAPAMPEVEVDGEALVDGVDVLSAKPGDIARLLGHVFQTPEEQLLALDVEGEVSLKPENLGISPREGVPLVVEALARFGLLGHERRPSAHLSGGEARRVALAQALANHPPVLLMDEPLTGLSARWKARVLDDVERAKTSATVLVAEHRAAPLAPLADRAFYLGEGKLIGIEPELLLAEARPAPAPQSPEAGDPLPSPAGDASGETRLAFTGARLARGGREILAEVGFSLEGGFVALTGENGAGKSTLLHAACGLLPLEEGSVRIAGLDPHEASAHDFATKVGYVPQRAQDAFTTRMVREEIALGPRAVELLDADEAVDREIARWGLTILQDRHPLSLSGGERQRLAFACALACEPEVLLLDEPTVGLDRTTLGLLLGAVREVAARGLVVAATHDDRLLAHADAVIELEGGRVHFAPPSKEGTS